MFFRPVLYALCLSWLPALASADTAMVLGYLNQTEHAVWQDNHVGFGVKSQLAQALYESGRYQLIEEKIDLEASTKHTLKLEDGDNNHWMLTPTRITPTDLASVAKQQAVDHLFWVTITGFGKPSRGFSIGIYYSRAVKTIVKLKVCRYSTATASIQCGEGEGSSNRRANAFLYQIRQDKKAQGLFQTSQVGKTSHQAVANALTQLLSQ